MTLATINYSTTDWDDKIKIVVRGDCPTIIILESAESALEINRVLTIAYFEDHEGQMTLDIDGSEYTFSQATWQALLSVTDQWLEQYMPATHPEFYQESAEIIPLFG
jgi:hypothetical protein